MLKYVQEVLSKLHSILIVYKWTRLIGHTGEYHIVAIANFFVHETNDLLVLIIFIQMLMN